MGRKQASMDSERRRFLKVGVYLFGAVTIGGYIAYESLRNPSYSEAYGSEKLRHRWADGLETREYAKIRIATPAVLEELKNKKNYTPPKGAFAATFPVDDARIGAGSRSNVYVFPECFDPVYKEHIADMGTIIENVIENHELVHADHYAKGIPDFPLKLFLRQDGSIDKNLFTTASEIVAYKREFLGLQEEKHRFVAEYRKGLRALANSNLGVLGTLTKDSSLVGRLQEAGKF